MRTLTVLVVPGRDADRPADAMPWFPVVGALIGLIMFLPAWACQVPGKELLQDIEPWPAGIALVMLAFGVLVTGGLHLDGVGDWADGFFGARKRERVLEIMKDPRVGSFGVIALVLVLLAKWAALTRIVGTEASLNWVIVAAIASRYAQVELAASLPYARAEGGTAGAFVDGAGMRHRVWALLLALIGCGVCCGPAGFAALAIAWILIRSFRRYCRSRIGGVTGDLLGAGSELVETTLLMLAAAFGTLAAPFTGWEFVVEGTTTVGWSM